MAVVLCLFPTWCFFKQGQTLNWWYFIGLRTVQNSALCVSIVKNLELETLFIACLTYNFKILHSSKQQNFLLVSKRLGSATVFDHKMENVSDRQPLIGLILLKDPIQNRIVYKKHLVFISNVSYLPDLHWHAVLSFQSPSLVQSSPSPKRHFLISKTSSVFSIVFLILLCLSRTYFQSWQMKRIRAGRVGKMESWLDYRNILDLTLS